MAIEVERPTVPRLIRLVIDGFRGSPRRTEFDMDASAVLLWGPNGTGKTTVFDAVQWVLIGDLPRLRHYTLRKNEEYVASSFSSNAVAVVEAHFRLADEVISVRRVGNARGTDLEVTTGATRLLGPAAEVKLRDSLVSATMPVADVLLTSGLLQQDELRQLLQTKPDERYRQLLGLLGLEVLERFDRFARSRRDRAREAARGTRDNVARLRDQVQTASERVETARLSVSRTSEESTGAGGDAPRTYGPELAVSADLSEPGAAASLSGAARQIARTIEGHIAELASVPQELPGADPAALRLADEAVERRAAELALSRLELSQAQETVAAASRTQDAISRLAAAALPLLEVQDGAGPCPVCETVVDVADVASRLRVRAAAGAAIAAAEQVVRMAEERLERATAELSAARTFRDSLTNARGERDRAVRTLRRSIRAIASLKSSAPGSGIAVRITDPLLDTEDDQLDAMDEADLHSAWLASRASLVPLLDRIADELNALADAAATTASAQTAARIANDRAATLPRLEAELASLRSELEVQESAYEFARRAETAANTLSQQTTSAAADIFQQRFSTLAPLMNDIYSRLDPHPAFTHLDFRIEPYRTKGTAIAQVLDEEADIAANPMLVFSSAQANAVVLATFLALGWAARDRGLPFVLLDDPLQALDDVNVLGFADIGRQLRRQRQLVVATHDERFAMLLERKLSGREAHEELVVHEFRGWTRSGPIVDSRRVKPRSGPQLAVLAS